MKAIKSILVGLCFSLSALAVEYNVNTEISSADLLPADHVFDVAEGITVTVSTAIDDDLAAVTVTKRGEGTLKLAKANGFSGGLDIQAGPVWVCAAGALGSGDVSIASGADANGVLVFEAPGASFANDISVTTSGNATYAISVRADVTLDGDIVGSGAFNVENGTAANFQTAIYNGLFSPRGAVSVRAYGTNVFNGRISMASSTLTLGVTSSNQGVVRLNNAGNEIKEISTYQPKIFCGAKGALGGAILSIPANYSRLGGNHRYDLAEYDQTIGYFNAPQTTGNTGNDTQAITSDTPCTLTLSGAEGKEVVGTYRLCGHVALVVDATSTFTQTLTDIKENVLTTHTTDGTMTIKGGAVRVTGAKTTFENMPQIDVEASGSLAIDTDGQVTFPAVTALNVAGKLEFGASAGKPLTDQLATLALGEGAELTINTEDKVIFGSVTVAGKPLANDDYIYPDDRVPQLKAGGFTVMGGSVVEESSWTGAGTQGAEITDEANWDEAGLDFTHGVLSPTFASGGSSATVSSEVVFRNMTLSAAAGEDGFSFAKGGDEGLVALSGTELTLATADDAKIYDFAVPVEGRGVTEDLKKKLTIAVPANTTIRLDEGVNYPDGSVEFVGNGGFGFVEFRGESTIGGALTFQAGFSPLIAGQISTPGHINQGAASANGAYTLSSLTTGSATTENTGLQLDNAVIEKPVYIPAGTSVAMRYAIWGMENSTNRISGNLMFGKNAGATGIRLHENSELTLCGGVNILQPFRFFGETGARLLVNGSPLDCTAEYTYQTTRLELGFSVQSGDVVFDATGNTVNYLNVGTGDKCASKVTFMQDDLFAVTSTTLTAGLAISGQKFVVATDSKVAPIVEFNGTKQRFGRVAAGFRATFHGTEGSLLEVNGEQVADDYVGEDVLMIAAPFTGALGLKMNGTGTLVLSNGVNTSVGGVEVASGELRFAPGTKWDGASLALSGDGILSTPSGTRLKFKSLTVDGEPAPGGLYTYATAPEAIRKHLAATSGEIQIGKPGLILLLR